MRLSKIVDDKRSSLVILLIIHLLYRFFLLSIDAFPFNSDEAIVGLMAKHILEGESFLYFYGQSYMGSLDAYLVALGFLLFGQSVLVIRLIQVFLYGLTIIFVFLFLNNAFRNTILASFSAIFLVFAPVNVILYTTVSLGGYGEALLLGVLSFYIAEKIRPENLNAKLGYWYFSLLGLILGVGLFVNPLSLTIIIPAIVYVIYKFFKTKSLSKLKRFLPILCIFFILGSIPFWYSLFFTNGFSVINEITGSAVAVEETTFLDKTISHFGSFVLFGPSVILGLRAPWSVEWIGRYFIPVILFFWILMIYLFFSKYYRKTNVDKLLFIFLTVVLVVGGFIFSSFGVDPSGRYFLPIIFPLSVMFGYGLVHFRNKLVLILSVFVLLFQIYGTVTSALREPYITTQFYAPAQVNQSKISELIEFLSEKNELYGYTNYWVSYPLAFLSNEEIIAIPELPYHPDLRYTSRDNRIESYNKIVESGRTSFFITTNNLLLDDLIIKKLNEKQILFKLTKIGDHQIYYNLSQKISPFELGLTNEFK